VTAETEVVNEESGDENRTPQPAANTDGAPMQLNRNTFFRSIRRPAALVLGAALMSGFAAAGVASAFAVPPATASEAAVPQVAARPVDSIDPIDIARWSDMVWNAAKSGDLDTVEKALANVPPSVAALEAKRLRDFIAVRNAHVDEGTKVRDADRAKALEEMKEASAKGETTKALTAAVKLQTLSDNWAAALDLPEMRELFAKAETAEATAQKDGDWLVAQEILFRMRTLFEESGDAAAFRRYDAQLDEVNKRIMLLAQYAPRELWRLRADYSKRFDPTKPLPEFNEAFAEDWKEALDGISRGMLTAALEQAAEAHISAGGWEPLISGGIDAVRVLATTPTLRENFAGLADPEKAAVLVKAANRAKESLAALDRTAIAEPQYREVMRDLLAANAAGPALPDEVIIREFGDGALEELSKRFEDEYTQIIWPDQLRRFEQTIRGNFVGVGILIRHDDRRDIQVVNPLEGSPAARSGVKSEDRIVAVDGKATVGWTLNKAVDSITGPAGQTVTLSVKRDGAEEPIDLKLVREQIKIRSVNGWWKKALDEKGQPVWDWFVSPDSGIGYVRLTGFNADSFDDFLKAIREMRAERPLNGLILDLRHNPGGLLTSAEQFSNAFVERGMIVSCKDRNGRVRYQKGAEPGRAVLKDLPLVVLVNQGSASASEIVSGCLKAHDRAVVLGDRSFGKGSVQTVHDVSGPGEGEGASLKLTTQYYYLAPGPGEVEQRLVHKKPGATDWGVNPDLVVKMTPEQIEKSLLLRQDADVIEEWKAVDEQKPRPDVQDLLTKGIDPQLELALLVLEAKTLKQFEAAAQAAATDKPSADATKGG
jgi:carboxyl-terminal processing protease